MKECLKVNSGFLYPQRNSVTIIIPVYKDFATLKECIRSLKKCVDPRHKVIIINDCSPDGNMRKDIIDEIDGDGRFAYYQNERNLGFVSTCNKGVKELDQSGNDVLILNSDTEATQNFLEEMLDVLYDCEKHGIVCPRSNNATILSVPFHYDGDRNAIVTESYSCYLKIKPLLPRFNIIPTAVGFCMLIKRQLIDRYGLFDEIYSPGYNEENDFTLRINRYGYSSVMANHAFVFHYGVKSFTAQERNELDGNNQKILLERYPYYDRLVGNYLAYQIHPADHFSNLMEGALYKKPKILFSLYNLPVQHNGTSEYGLNLLNCFFSKYKDKYDISILANPEGAEFHGLRSKYENVYDPDGITGTYHLTICPSQIFDVNHLLLLNRISLKILVTMQDIITLRCRYLYIGDPRLESVFAMTLRYADGIIALTDYAKQDMKKYFQPFMHFNEKLNVRIISHGISGRRGDIETTLSEMPFQDYVLIVGNESFQHKSTEDCIAFLQDMEINFCVLGCSDVKRNNVKCFQSGHLSDRFVESLYRFAKLIIFPSTYEGFGLPVIKSLFYSKSIVVLDNEINRELSKQYGTENFLFFKTYDEIKRHISNCPEGVSPRSQEVRSWENVAEDTEKFVEEILHMEINPSILEKRWYSLLSMEQQIRERDEVIRDQNNLLILWKNELDKVTGRRLYRFFDKLVQTTPIYKFYRVIRGS